MRRPDDRIQCDATKKITKINHESRPGDLAISPASYRSICLPLPSHGAEVLTWPTTVRGGRFSASQPGGSNLSRDNVHTAKSTLSAIELCLLLLHAALDSIIPSCRVGHGYTATSSIAWGSITRPEMLSWLDVTVYEMVCYYSAFSIVIQIVLTGDIIDS